MAKRVTKADREAAKKERALQRVRDIVAGAFGGDAPPDGAELCEFGLQNFARIVTAIGLTFCRTDGSDEVSCVPEPCEWNDWHTIDHIADWLCSKSYVQV